jgi:hypothetical protein
MATAVSFDGNNLQTFDGSHGIIIQEIDHHGTAEKVAPVYKFAHANGMSIPSTSYGVKSIPVNGEIVGNSLADLDALIDTFKYYFAGEQKNLDIGYNGTTRRYIASSRTIPIPRPNGLFSATFELIFDCQPFGQDITSTTALNVTGRTASGYTDSFVFTGTAQSGQLPLFTITYTALTSTGVTAVQVGNTGTGQQITIMRGWLSGDVLTIDCANKTVKVNGTKVDFAGAFPMFPKGSQGMSYSDTHTTRTFNELVTYNALWG